MIVGLSHTLAYHLYVDASFSEDTKEFAGNTNAMLQFLPNKGNDAHIWCNIHRSKSSQIVDRMQETFILNIYLIGACYSRNKPTLAMDSHGNMHFARRDQIHRQMMTIQDAKDLGQEPMRASPLRRVHIKHDDILLNSDGRRAFRSPVRLVVELGGGARAKQLGLERVGGMHALVLLLVRVWVDDGAGAAWVHDVLDADGDAGADDLLHDEGVHDFGPVEGELGGLGWGDVEQEASCWHFAWISCEDAWWAG
jgi:hypothetical protein